MYYFYSANFLWIYSFRSIGSVNDDKLSYKNVLRSDLAELEKCGFLNKSLKTTHWPYKAFRNPN